MTTAQQIQVAAGVIAVCALSGVVRHRTRQHRRCSFKGRSVLITGGSRGLGLVIARRMAAEGALVTIAARDRDELERACKELERHDVVGHVIDISQGANARHLVQAVLEHRSRLDVLINNAGVIKVGPLAHMETSDFEEAMGVHFWGPLHAMLAALPAMRQQQFGRIVNISSIGGKIAVPHMAPYCASKFALAGLSDAIRAEVARDGIAVTTVVPGLMRTGSPFNAWFKGRHRHEFSWFALLDSLPVLSMQAETAAHAIVEACRYGDAHVTLGWPAKLGIAANALFPDLVASSMALLNQHVLPDSTTDGNLAHSGWQSRSAWVPSVLTRLTERAARDNNEVAWAATGSVAD
jgi:NAD(P)-dependent dehydrogenase (short-subunit alcohol dehydrogenase family)